MHSIFAIKLAPSIPYAPHLKIVIKITFNITVTTPAIKLPKEYLLLSPKPLLICRKTDENIDTITFASKKYL